MDPYLFKRLIRRPMLSLCSLILTGTLCFLLCFLSGYQAAQKQELANTRENFDLLCVVTNRRGTQSVSLRMGSSNYFFLTDPEGEMKNLIRDLRATKEFHVNCVELGISNQNMIGVTNERCAEDLDPAMGAQVTWFTEPFYDSAEPVCLVSRETYEQLLANRMREAEDNDMEFQTAELEGVPFQFHVTDPFVYPGIEEDIGLGKTELRLAGFYEGTGETVYIPFQTSQELAYAVSQRTSVDSLAFLAMDNENTQTIMEAASELYGTVDPLADEFSMPRYALTIHDEQYRSTIAALEQNIERTGYLLPLILALSLGVGFLISFLSTRGESRTYALMRTLGMNRGKLALSILREQLILSVLAALILGALTQNWSSAGAYLVCHALGCAIAVIRSVRTAPTAILREQE